MKIVHVSDCFLPRLGGLELQVADLARAQAEGGHSVCVVTATPGEASQTEVAEYPPVYRIGSELPFKLPLDGRADKHLTSLFRMLSPEVVHIHLGAISPFGWAATHFAIKAKIPCVLTVHSTWDAPTSALYRAFDKIWHWSTSGLLLTTVSQAAALPILKVVAGNTRVHVVPNAIDPSSWRPTGSVPPAEPDRPLEIVAVGRLAPRKKPLALLQLLRQAKKQLLNMPLHVRVIGDGPARPMMDWYLALHGMSGWVEVAGRLERDQVAEALWSADIFVAPAPYEAFGLAALEARCAGVPVVARSGSGVGDFITSGVEGLLGDSSSALADAVVRLATDSVLRRSIARNNRSIMPTNCCWPSVQSAFEGCYNLAKNQQCASIPRITQTQPDREGAPAPPTPRPERRAIS